MSENLHQVGMAQYVVIKAPGIIRSSGLGSCLGVILYDPVTQIGGMAHAMLPKFRLGRQDNQAKYVDSSIEVMLDEMEKLGSQRENIIAKLAGGAQMFPDADRDVLVIGQKNILSGRECLAALKISIVAEEVGGNCGRSLEFNCTDGSLLIKTTQNSTKI